MNDENFYDVIVIGGGPAGSFCASNIKNKRVLLIEKNDKIGKKLYITGKGRCNLTNNCDPKTFLDNVVSNPKFMFGCINKFTPADTMNTFEKYLPLVTERGNRVFPLSNKSSDIISALKKMMEENNVFVKLGQKVESVEKIQNKFVVKTDKQTYTSSILVVSTGGKSYSQTGSDGWGYKIAKMFNHEIIGIRPALVGIKLKEYNGSLAGLTLKNVKVSIVNGDKILYTQFGEMLFTHSGVSGPIILTMSSFVNKLSVNGMRLVIDLKPAVEFDELRQRFCGDMVNSNKKMISNVLNTYMPSALVPVVLNRCGIEKTITLANISKVQRDDLINAMKFLDFNINSLDDIDTAIITSGGVCTKQLNPTTMESKIVENMYFIGEVIDVDALTGGFNLQVAFSTAYSAANGINEKV